MRTTIRQRLVRYGMAAATVALAMLIKTIADFVFGGGPPLILFLSAVMVTARFAGPGPGLVATALSALVCDYLYFPPGGSLKIHSLNDAFLLSVFVLEGLAFSVLMGSLHAARRRAEERTAQQARLADWSTAVSLGLTRTSTLPDLLRHCTLAMVEHLDAALARIWTLSDAGDAVELQASAGLYTHIDGPHGRIPIGRLKIGMIAAERRPHLTNAVIGDPQVPNQEWADREGLVAFAGYPLIVEDRLVGVMAMFARRPLTETTLQALASVANAVAVGVERKRAEEDLASSHLERQIVFDTIPDILYVLDSDGCLVRWNRKMETLTGFSPEELKGKRAVDMVPHNERDAAAEAIRLGWETGFTEVEIHLVRKDGTACPIQWTGVPLKNAKGDRIGLTGMGRDVTEQRRAAEKLRMSEARLAEAQQIAQVGSWEWDANTNEVLWSDELYRICGEEPGMYEPTLDKLSDFIYISDNHEVLDKLNECLACKSRLDCCFRIVRRDGSIRVGRSRGEVVVDGEGRPVRMVGTLQDITDVKRIEEELVKTRQVAEAGIQTKSEFLANMSQEIRDAQKLALIANRTHNGVVLADPQGRIEWVNDGFTRITEYTFDEVIGRSPGSLLQGPETDRAIVEYTRAQIRKGEGFRVEMLNYAKSGRKYWAAIEIEPIHDALGRLIHFMAIEADVTERKQAEQDRNRLATIVESSDDAIIGMDLEGVVTSWNAGAERIFGYQADEMVGRMITYLSPPEREHEDPPILEKLRLGERVEHFESVRIAKDGRSIDVSLTMSPIKDHSGRIIGVSKIARDITEFKKQAQSLFRAKKLAEAASQAKSQFLANMSHEIRTPLTAVIGFAEMLRRGVDDEAERRDCIDTIVSSGRHVLSLLSDILDLSKIEAGRIEYQRIRCSPNQVLSDVLSILRIHAAEKGLSLECQWEGRAPESIETDPDRLRQLLMNLVGNAIKFTDRGAVRVVAAVRFDEPEPRMAIEVRDTGIGIAPENVDRIFSPFDQADVSVTRRFGGTGLGLTISRHIARSLGGDLAAASRLGEGSVFRATIATGPLDEGRMKGWPLTEALASHDPTAAFTTHLNGARILLVEDGATNRKLITLMLRRAGAEVVCAVDGQAGFEAATEQRFDLIFMDMQMPVLDGYEATRRLRAAGYIGPIVALTAHALRGDAELCSACGCDDYLVKPIEHDRLLNAVEEHMNKATPARTSDLSPPSVASRRASELTSALPTDDPEFREIVEEFLVTLDARLRAMRAAWEREDRDELARLAHWLKGAGGTAGFDAFTEPARRLEEHAKHGPRDDAGHALHEVEILSGRIVAASQISAEVGIATCRT
ncbi:MAG: PAS domain S-box protein [Isosphaerales bacterium]